MEIGAGLGSLTRSLADLSLSVTAVEIDPLLEPILRETLAGYENVRLVIGDFLKLAMDEILNPNPNPDGPFGSAHVRMVVVGSIPYYITSPILERLLENKRRIKRIVLTVQKEVADRLAAKPGTSDYGSMSVFAQYHAEVEIMGNIPRTVFLPRPDVDSAIVRLTPVIPGTVEVTDEEAFFRIVRAAFGQRRKTILNALVGGEIGLNRESAERLLHCAGIDSGRRGETLSLQEFARLASNT